MSDYEDLIAEARERFAAARHSVDSNSPMAQTQMILVAGFVPKLLDGLAEHDRQEREKAWNEGHETHRIRSQSTLVAAQTVNPYRKQEPNVVQPDRSEPWPPATTA